MNMSPRLSLSYLSPQQAQKHVTVNESLRRLDALTQLAVVSRSQTAEPAAPQEGDAYILPAAASGGAWSAMATASIAAFQDGAWREIAPGAGWRAWAADEETLLVFDGAAWTALSAGGGEPSMLGVNASPDATNRLSVKSNVELLSHDDVTPGTGDARKIINRAGSGGAASVVFQTGFSGQAEFGLIGDDRFRLKVSDDGEAFLDALIIDTASGDVGVGAAPKAKLFVKGDNLSDPGVGDLHIEKDGYFALFFLDTYADGAASFSIQRRARGTLAAPAAVQAGDSCGGFSFRGYNAAGGFTQAAIIYAPVDGAVSGAAVPTALAFSTGSASAAERMRITSAGDVGVGVSAPTTKLHVDGPVRCKSYTVAGAPSAASAGAGSMIFVSNESGGATLAFSDGANWRRVADRAVIS